MSTPLLILISLFPADGSHPVTADIHLADIRQDSLSDLIRRSWSGTWAREGTTDKGAHLDKGIMTLPMNPPARFRLTIDAEGAGWFRGRINGAPVVGIWRYERGRLRICWGSVEKGWPKRFEDEEQRDLMEFTRK